MPKLLTLERAIALALNSNGSSQAAVLTFHAAEKGVTAAKAEALPQVTANLGYAYNGTNGGSTASSGGLAGDNSRSQTTVEIGVSQSLFNAGRTSARVNQARAEALGSAGDLGVARNSLAYQVAQRYYEQLRQERLVSQREGQVRLAQSQLDLIKAQFQAGGVARSDIWSVQVNLSQAQLDLTTARNDLRVAQTSLRNILGLSRGPALALEDSLGQSPLSRPQDINDLLSGKSVAELFPPEPEEPMVPTHGPASLDEALKVAQLSRPDLVQARASVAGAQASLKLARIDADPQVTASASYAVDSRSNGQRGFNFSATLTMPLFDGGATKANKGAAQDLLSAAQVRLDQTQNDVEADVESAFVDRQGQQERLRNARTLVEQAAANLQNATARYRAGAGIVLDVVNAQTQLFNAQNSYTGILYEGEISHFNLLRAIGRFAWSDPGQPSATAPADLKTAKAGVGAVAASAALPSSAQAGRSK